MKLLENRAYYKSELAAIIGICWRTIARIIKKEKSLGKRLKELGYSKDQQVLTPAQVAVIHNFLSNEDRDKLGLF